nr:retrovirus-related Pol polyprotein from transposon TNT 1-94 [Tanacetum cinerariifolium]
KDVFLLSHEKCVACYAFSRNSNVKRDLFTTLVVAKSKNLGATFVVAKSRLSVANTPKATNKVFSVSSLSYASSQKQVTTEPNSPVLNANADEFVQEDVADFDGNVFNNAPLTLMFEEAESSSTYLDPSNMHEFHQKHCASDTWTKNHPIEQVIGEPSKPHLEGDDLLTSSRDSNLYTISIFEMVASSPVCLMSRATLIKSWLWHRRLSYLNFGTINQLTLKDLVDGLSKFKYNKDHLCSACEQGKSKKTSLPPKLVPSIESKLELLHMDLCGQIRVASINGKKNILVIVDDYSRYTWKHEMEKYDTVCTPMATTKLDTDLQETQADQTKYCSMIGGPMYLIDSQPGIAFATFVCARYQAHPTEKHLKEMQTLQGVMMIAKSTSGGIQFLGDKLVSWSSKKQDCTAMSTAKAEYVSLSACCAQVIWMRMQLLNYGFRYNKIYTVIHKVQLPYLAIRTEYQLDDLFTKTLPKERFECLVHIIGMRCMTPTRLEHLAKSSS